MQKIMNIFSSSESGVLSRFFKFKTLNTNMKTEVLAGITTFMTMAYVLAAFKKRVWLTLMEC